MILQGDVESVASKNPQDMMKHFEIFCGSFDLKYARQPQLWLLTVAVDRGHSYAGRILKLL
jgi:hypothetical protein